MSTYARISVSVCSLVIALTPLAALAQSDASSTAVALQQQITSQNTQLAQLNSEIVQ